MHAIIEIVEENPWHRIEDDQFDESMISYDQRHSEKQMDISPFVNQVDQNVLKNLDFIDSVLKGLNEDE